MTHTIDGRKATVVTAGHVYSSFDDFAKRNGYPEAVDGKTRIKNGEVVTLLTSETHGPHSSTVLWIVENADGERQVIGEDGLDIHETPVTVSIADFQALQRKVDAMETDMKRMDTQLRVAREDIVLVEEGVSDDVKRLEAAVFPSKEAPETSVPSVTRQDVIDRAKKDVETLERTHRHISGNRIGFWPVVDGEGTCWIPMQRVNYVINREKKTVVALIRFLPTYEDGDVYARGKSRCAPDDVFNVHVGRAIALRRALGLDVPDEYVHAPKPTEVMVGDVVTFKDGTKTIYRVDNLASGGRNCTILKSAKSSRLNGSRAHGDNFSWARIVDDSRLGDEMEAYK